MLLGFVVLLPKLIEWLAQALRPLMDWMFGPEGVLAIDTMTRTPRRTSATVGAVMIGLSFVYSNGAAIRSHYDSVLRSIDRTLNPDMIVTASTQLRSLTYRFNETFGKQIGSIADVASAECKRFTFVPYQGDSVALVATDTDVWLGRVGDIFESGDYQTARRTVSQGQAVLVSENFAQRWNIGLGNRVRLDSPLDVVELPVAGVIEDYHSEKGTVFIERAVYKAHWGDSSIDYVNIKLNPDADTERVRREIQDAAAGQQEAFVYTNTEYKKWIRGLMDQFFILYDVQIIIAILVAAIGIINTLTISVSERKREFGVIRAIGGLPSQTRKMVLLEALAIAVVGIITGVVSSVFNTYFLVRTASTIIAGSSLPFRFPLDLILVSLPVTAVVAVGAAWLPACRATRLSVAEALAYE
jgi:putative ABC transport system permease protein